MGFMKPWHIIVLVAVLVLLFGAKRLPDAARALGRSLRILKAETRSLADDRDLAEKADAQAARQPLPGDSTVHPTSVHQPGYQPPAAPAVDPVQRVRDN
jgi:sec-independent protein translocase protein TatA